MGDKETAKAGFTIDRVWEKFREEETNAYKKAATDEGKEPDDLRIRKRVARDFLKAFVEHESNLDQLPELKEPLHILFSNTRESKQSVTRTNIRVKLAQIFTEKKTISEQDVFMLTMEEGSTYGRTEMKKFIQDSINKAPESRLWIKFVPGVNTAMGNYTLIGTGPNAPKDWDGYLPKDATENGSAVDM